VYQVAEIRIDAFEGLHEFTRLLQIVFLMIILGGVELLVGPNIHEGLLLRTLLDALFGLLCLPFLLVAVVENNVGILAISCLPSGLDAGPEDFEQTLVGNHQRVELYLSGLGMAIKIVVGRAAGTPAGVAYLRRGYSAFTPEPGVGTPESAHGKSGGLQLGVENGFYEDFLVFKIS